MTRILLAGGGTGGHLFPAVAIAERLAETNDVDIMFVGTKNRIEARVVPQLGYKFRAIWIGGFSRKFRLSNFLLPVKVVVSILQALRLLLTYRPQVVVGTGGYVSGPVCAAAVIARVPIVLQEHNSYPGVMTRMFSPFAREVHIAFESSKKYFRVHRNLYLTGSPLRKMPRLSQEAGRSHFGLSAGRKTLLVTGGSLGAVGLNSAVLNVVDDLIGRNYQLIWQTGSVDFERIKESQKNHPDLVHVEKFVEKMEFAYAAADIAVCRGGATTVAELIYFNLPSLIIPYPYAAANHQVENARALVESGAAVMVQEADIREKFSRTLLDLVDNAPHISDMREKIKNLSHQDAADVIAKSILRIAGNA
ncbi:MAG: undecaprenyldiphospho-muramoylpentapeptide beta-N-acetylglucosaminyltransferase [Bacteroidetes bacterium]|nr:undecaprenyldiphospho-muramoylpentapeptide beta-N-acetylglucosaminyltransferase [Bacteroidota bacterium]